MSERVSCADRLEYQPVCLQVSRQSIDAVKEYFREDLQKSDWQLMVELKKQFHIYTVAPCDYLS